MRPSIAALCVGFLILAAAPAVATSQSRAQEEVADPLNHAFAVYLGGGLYVTGDSTVFTIRFGAKIRIRDERKHAFGVRLRLVGVIGLYDTEFKLEDIGDLPSRIGTWAAMPGVEFPVRIFDNWTLMPFIDAGVASDTKFHDTTIVTGIGARSRAEFKDKRHFHVLWNELIAAANHDQQFVKSDDYTLFRIDYEMRGIVDYKLLKREFDMGLLLLSETYFNSPILGPPGRQLQINQRFEVGLTTGATEQWKAIKNKITTPRVGVSYRFGEGTRSVRFVIRFRN
jgi:hypothetical protein